MNGEKGMLSEGGIRVPYVVTWPGIIPAEQVFDEPVSSLDVAATSFVISEAEGGISVAWRLMGDDDFVKGNAAKMKKNGSVEFELLVSATETVIHLRIKLPEGNVLWFLAWFVEHLGLSNEVEKEC